MKKLAHVLFFLLLSPILMGAVTHVAKATAATDVASQTNPEQSLKITSDMFGWNGPFSAGVEYSRNFGYIFHGRFTQSFWLANAFSLGVEYGQNQRRVDATLASVLSARQRLKLTAEYLSQNLDFNFASGKTDERVSQPAYGFTYQYLIEKGILDNFSFTGTYSRAISQTLRNQLYVSSSNNLLNLRHIAGATDKGVSAGIELLPFKMTRVGIKANYDDVRYNTRYSDNDAKDVSGFGGSISLDQLITHRVKLNFLASDRKPFEDYKAGISWLLHSAPGTRLEFGVSGDRLIAQSGTENDSRIGFDLSYSWDGSETSRPSVYEFQSGNSVKDLAEWANEPAVHREDVLAVRDEKSVTAPVSFVVPPVLGLLKATGLPEPNPDFNHNAPTGQVGTAYSAVIHGLNTDVVTDGMFIDAYYNVKYQRYVNLADINAELAPSGLTATYNADTNQFVISGTPVQNGTYVLHVKMHNYTGWGTGEQEVVVTIGNLISPTFDAVSMPHFIEGEVGTTQSVVTAHAGTGDSFLDANAIQIKAVDTNGHAHPLSYFGLASTVQLQNSHQDAAISVGSDAGAKTMYAASAPQEYEITATNVGGGSAKIDFIVTISPALATPSFDMVTNPTYQEGVVATTQQVTIAHAGHDQTFTSASAIQVQAKDTNGHSYSLDHFGLQSQVMLQAGNSDAAISVSAMTAGGTAAASADSPQDYEITVTNSASKTATTSFVLTVNPAIATPTFDAVNNPTYTEGEVANTALVTTAHAGSGETFVNTSAINVTAKDTSGHSYALSHYGLKADVVLQNSNNDAAVSVSAATTGGTAAASADSPQDYEITVTNSASKTATTSFALTVNPAIATPTFDAVNNPTYTEGEVANTALVTTAHAGSGETFVNAGAISVTAKDTSGHSYALSHYGLKADVVFQNSNSDAAVSVSAATTGGTAAASADSPQDYEITVTNSSSKTATTSFTLTVNSPVTTTAYLTCPTSVTISGGVASQTVTDTKGQSYTFQTSSSGVWTSGTTLTQLTQVRYMDANTAGRHLNCIYATKLPSGANGTAMVLIASNPPVPAPQYDAATAKFSYKSGATCTPTGSTLQDQANNCQFQYN